MNKDQRRGRLENLKGRVKEATGALTGDKAKQAEGAIDRVKGAVKEKIGELKHDAARDIDDSGGEDSDR